MFVFYSVANGKEAGKRAVILGGIFVTFGISLQKM